MDTSYEQRFKEEYVNEWEKFATQLIRERYKAENVEIIPCKTHGDDGLDVLVRNKGIIYQLFRPNAVKKEAFTRKINTDIEKLVKNEKEIAKIANDLKVDLIVMYTTGRSNIKDFISSWVVVIL